MDFSRGARNNLQIVIFWKHCGQKATVSMSLQNWISELRGVHVLAPQIAMHFAMGGRGVRGASAANLTELDALFVPNPTVELLFQLNRSGAFQIYAVGDQLAPEEMCDGSLTSIELMRISRAVSSIHPPSLEPLSCWPPFDSWINSPTRLPGETPALFLDRDGVIVENVEYNGDPSKVRLREGIADLIRQARRLEMKVICVTNQSGLGRGYFGWEQHRAVEKKILEELEACGEGLDATLVAPFWKSSENQWGIARPNLRKPRPGLFHAAAVLHGIDLRKSRLIGDSASDLKAAALAGVPKATLVHSDRFDTELETWSFWSQKYKPFLTIDTNDSALSEVKL